MGKIFSDLGMWKYFRSILNNWQRNWGFVLDLRLGNKKEKCFFVNWTGEFFSNLGVQKEKLCVNSLLFFFSCVWVVIFGGKIPSELIIPNKSCSPWFQSTWFFLSENQFRFCYNFFKNKFPKANYRN